ERPGFSQLATLYCCVFRTAAFSRMARTRIAVFGSVGLFFLLGLEAQAAEPKRVLMLHAFNYTFPATSVLADAARRRLLEHSPQSVEIDAEFLDLARNTNAAHEE